MDFKVYFRYNRQQNDTQKRIKNTKLEEKLC